jgi:hypothetical protein
MARRPWATSVEEHYASRHRPYGRNVDPSARNRIAREPAFETASAKAAFNKPDVQDPEDRHDAGYRNDSQGWTRGARGVPTCENETAENYPQGNFDKGQSYRRADKGNDWGSGSDTQQQRRPERITTTPHQRRDD